MQLNPEFCLKVAGSDAADLALKLAGDWNIKMSEGTEDQAALKCHRCYLSYFPIPCAIL